MCNQYMEYLNNYFGGKNENNEEIKPICREERQFALFLYNKLLNMVGKDYESIEDNDKDIYLKIFDLDKENIPDNTPKLLKVYYEVTFMRDFLFRVKNQQNTFNNALFEFVTDRIKNCCDFKDEKIINDITNIQNSKQLNIYNNIDYGGRSEKRKEINCDLIIKFMSAMMKSKADLGILYKIGDENYLKLIECKYESGVDEYDFGNNFKMPQYVIQYYITKFICEKLFPKNAIVADCTLLVNFRETHPRLCKIKCNSCDNSFESDNIDCLSNYIKKNAKFIPLDSLIPVELKNNIY